MVRNGRFNLRVHVSVRMVFCNVAVLPSVSARMIDSAGLTYGA